MGISHIQLMSFSHGSLSISLAAMFNSGLMFGANGKKNRTGIIWKSKSSPSGNSFLAIVLNHYYFLITELLCGAILRNDDFITKFIGMI